MGRLGSALLGRSTAAGVLGADMELGAGRIVGPRSVRVVVRDPDDLRLRDSAVELVVHLGDVIPHLRLRLRIVITCKLEIPC